MDFIRYAEAARRWSTLTCRRAGLVRHLDGREWLHGQSTEQDCIALCASSGPPPGVRGVGGRRRPAVRRPQRADGPPPDHPDDQRPRPDEPPHARRQPGASVAELLISEALLGLATLVCDLGPTRLGVCSPSLRQRLRRHLAEPVAALLLGPLLLTGQRGGVPRPPTGRRPEPWCAPSSQVNDGPLIVQCDKTLLLEIDHPGAADCRKRDRAVRGARAHPGAHPHLPADPAGPWNARAAGHDAEQVDRHPARPIPAMPSRTRCWSTSRRRWRATAGCGWRSTRCTGWCWPRPTGRCSRRCCARRRSPGMLGERVDPDTVLVHGSERGNLKQALLKLGWPAEDFAGYVDGEAHKIELARGGLVAPALPVRCGRVVPARRLRCRRTPLWCGQDASSAPPPWRTPGPPR